MDNVQSWYQTAPIRVYRAIQVTGDNDADVELFLNDTTGMVQPSGTTKVTWSVSRDEENHPGVLFFSFPGHPNAGGGEYAGAWVYPAVVTGSSIYPFPNGFSNESLPTTVGYTVNVNSPDGV